MANTLCKKIAKAWAKAAKQALAEGEVIAIFDPWGRFPPYWIGRDGWALGFVEK